MSLFEKILVLTLCMGTFMTANIVEAQAVKKGVPGVPLLLDAKNDSKAPIPEHAVKLSAREGKFNSKAMAAKQIRVTLADGRNLDATKRQELKGNRGEVSWVGEFEDSPGSLLIVTNHKNVISGFINRGTEIFELGIGRNGKTVLYKVDESKQPGEGEPIPVNNPPDKSGDQSSGGDLSATSGTSTSAGDGLHVQDILIVYTPKALAKAGSVATMESRILNAVAAANSAYINSLINIRLNVVGISQVNYTETGDMTVTVSRLRGTTDGYMDEVHTLRNQTKADLVALISEDTNYCGYAYIMTSPSTSFASSAFSVTKQSCFSNQSFVHEIGHNQGNSHDRKNATAAVSPYSFGYRTCDNIAPSNGQYFRTVMAYSCSGNPRVNYFSNPNVMYNGAPMGVSYEANPSNSADNARSMNETASVVAAFRTETTALPPSAPSALASSVLSYDKITLSWSDTSNNETGFVIQRDSGSGFIDRASVGKDVTSYTDTGLNGSTQYQYRVRAYNSVGSSAYSNTTSAITSEAPPAPSEVTNVQLSLNSSSVTLTWTASIGATSYEILRESKHPKNGKWRSSSVTIGSNSTTYSVTLNSGTYRFKVRALNSVGATNYVTATCSTCSSDGSFTVAGSTTGGGGKGGSGKDRK